MIFFDGYSRLNKINTQLGSILWLNNQNKQTDLKETTQIHDVFLCLYEANPDTFLASNGALGTLFSSENSLFIQVWIKYLFLSLYHYLSNVLNM